MLLTLAGWMVAVLAIAGSIYTFGAGLLVRRFFRRRPAALTDVGAAAGTVTMVKPLQSDAPGLRANLETFFGQDTAADYDIVFGVRDARDSAIDVAEDLIVEHGVSSGRICLDPAEHGANRKISNVINVADGARGDILVLSDSDIGVSRDYLARVLAALAEPGVGVVSCPYYGKGEGGFWADFAAMGQSYTFLPNVVTGVWLGMAKPCMGSTIALRRETLERIGGFQAFRDVLADDYAIGAAVRALGLKSVVAPVLVSHSCAQRDFRSVFAQELRWARTVKGVDFAGHAGSVITHPLALALIAVLLLGFSPATTVPLAVSFAARLSVVSAVDRAIGRPLGPWWLIPVRDLASFAAFVVSFTGRGVEWGGAKFQVAANGDLIPL